MNKTNKNNDKIKSTKHENSTEQKVISSVDWIPVMLKNFKQAMTVNVIA